MLVKEEGLYGHAVSESKTRGLHLNSNVIVFSLVCDGSSALLKHDLHASLSVAQKLGVNTIETSVSLTSLFGDAESVLLSSLVVGRMVL